MQSSLPELGPTHALFLDFDGTLVDIAESPQAVRIDATLIDTLQRLSERLSGALALISGRPIADLDRLLAPLQLPAAGVHGAERRSAGGPTLRVPRPELRDVVAAALELARREPRLQVERKSAAVALHYRAAPAWEAQCIEAMMRSAARGEGRHLLRGKMVVEVIAADVSKGGAIDAFLREVPFAGRSPIFAGDDVTDETGFVAVQASGGIGIKVGPGETAAIERAESAAAVRRWLQRCATLLAP